MQPRDSIAHSLTACHINLPGKLNLNSMLIYNAMCVIPSLCWLYEHLYLMNGTNCSRIPCMYWKDVWLYYGFVRILQLPTPSRLASWIKHFRKFAAEEAPIIIGILNNANKWIALDCARYISEGWRFYCLPEDLWDKTLEATRCISDTCDYLSYVVHCGSGHSGSYFNFLACANPSVACLTGIDYCISALILRNLTVRVGHDTTLWSLHW